MPSSAHKYSFPPPILLLGGHALGLTPPGIELYALATDFYGFIGAYPHIILLLRGQLAHGLRSGLILADRHRLGFLKLTAGAVLHLVSGHAADLLPLDGKGSCTGADGGHRERKRK